jgi:putative ABC transport system permease protein
MPILHLALKSLLNRRLTALLTLLSIALSVTLLLGVERIRQEARHSFAATVSGADLIVGARSGPVQLLLYSLFHLGDATNNLSWKSYQNFAADPRVAWTIPISLGDSHRGYRVVGTETSFFDHFRYGDGQPVALAQGQPFADLYDAVIGSEVAAALGYAIGQPITLAHGASPDGVSFAHHDDKPFRVAGVLRPTGTPLDRAVLVSLAAIEAIHLGWNGGWSGVRTARTISADEARRHALTPKNLTAFLVGLHGKGQVFQVQRAVNEYRKEPLLAILPGVTLDQLWGLVGVAERALLAVSGFVAVVGLFGLLTALLTGLDERRREMAILRSVGARPGHIFALIAGEAAFLTLLGALLGVALLHALLLLAQPLIAAKLGLLLAVGLPGAQEILLLGAVVGAGLLAGLIPALRAYRLSLADGLSVRN